MFDGWEAGLLDGLDLIVSGVTGAPGDEHVDRSTVSVADPWDRPDRPDVIYVLGEGLMSFVGDRCVLRTKCHVPTSASTTGRRPMRRNRNWRTRGTRRPGAALLFQADRTTAVASRLTPSSENHCRRGSVPHRSRRPSRSRCHDTSSFESRHHPICQHSRSAGAQSSMISTSVLARRARSRG